MNNTEIKIDYLSATFPLKCDAEDSVLLRVHEMVYIVALYLHVSNFEILDCEYSQNHFKYQYQLGNYITLRLDGPLDKNYQKTCQLEMKGDACRDFERRNPDKTRNDLFMFLVSLNASFKRIDIAIDDFKGDLVDFEYLNHKVIKHDFYTSVFRHKPIPMGRKEYGMSIQFGSNQSNTELVIYDKLQERNKRKVECDKEYWVRFEMRFRNENADAIVLALVQALDTDKPQEEAMQEFAKSQLYRILDIKEDNKYNDANQKQVPTDSLWLKFLDNVRKAELVKLEKDKKQLNMSEYGDYVSPYLVPLFTALFMKNHKNAYDTELEFWKYLANHFQFTKHGMFRLNMFLKGLGYKPLDDEDLVRIGKLFEDIVEDKELPF